MKRKSTAINPEVPADKISCLASHRFTKAVIIIKHLSICHSLFGYQTIALHSLTLCQENSAAI